jgi:hypothetical protein
MRTLTTILLLAATAVAQTPSFTPFGTGCTFANQTLAIGNQGLPRIGQSFQITYSGPNQTFGGNQQIAWPQLALGFQQVTTVLPTTLLWNQPAGCTGFIAPIAMQATSPDPVLPVFITTIPIAIPNDPGLVGVQFLAQWLTLHQQCGFAGCNLDAALTSDAAIALIGI